MSQLLSPNVFLINDDPAERKSLEQLICAAGWQPVAFPSAHAFLSYPRGSAPCCLVLDVILPGLNGLELQDRIASERREMPIIFIADGSDVRIAVEAMKRGAMDFLAKPLDEGLLLATIQYALKRSETALGREGAMQTMRTDYQSLTPRERQVMTMVASGLPNKVVGGELGISEITVKMHRGNVMRKMKADSFAQLVNMASRLRVARSVTPSAVFA
jgi:FixJ family two-component response regulator